MRTVAKAPICSANGPSPVHEPIWAVVQRDSQDAHVVRVQDSVTEANTLPLSHKPGCADHDLQAARGLESDNGSYSRSRKSMSCAFFFATKKEAKALTAA